MGGQGATALPAAITDGGDAGEEEDKQKPEGNQEASKQEVQHPQGKKIVHVDLS